MCLAAVYPPCRWRWAIAEDKTCSDNIFSYYAQWQPNRSAVKSYNETKNKGEELTECTKETGWMGGEKRKQHETPEQEDFEKGIGRLLFCCAPYLHTELINWTQANQLSTQHWHCATSRRRHTGEYCLFTSISVGWCKLYLSVHPKRGAKF